MDNYYNKCKLHLFWYQLDDQPVLSFISKDVSKAIMHRSKLRNQFLKLQTHESRLRYNKQRNLCVTLLRKIKKYYTDLKMSDINDNKKFWKNVKPIFGNKNKGNKTIVLEEGNEVISDDRKLVQTFNEYFVNIVPRFGITSFHENNVDINNDNIDNTITKFEGHPSIVVIKERMKNYNKTFTFQNVVSTDKVGSIIKKLNAKKASKSDDIPTKVIKEFGTFFADFLSKNLNSCLETGSFPEDLKCAEVVPIYKKNDKKDKIN